MHHYDQPYGSFGTMFYVRATSGRLPPCYSEGTLTRDLEPGFEVPKYNFKLNLSESAKTYHLLRREGEEE
jgi:hypothetical protein